MQDRPRAAYASYSTLRPPLTQNGASQRLLSGRESPDVGSTMHAKLSEHFPRCRLQASSSRGVFPSPLGRTAPADFRVCDHR